MVCKISFCSEFPNIPEKFAVKKKQKKEKKAIVIVNAMKSQSIIDKNIASCINVLT